MIAPIRVYVFKETCKRSSDENIYNCAELFCRAENKVKGLNSLNSLPKIVREMWKKPRFDKDIGLYFSVSHSGEFWVCAMSTQEVGIDIQKKTNNYNTGIAKRFFHADEHEYLEHNGFDEFFSVWTAKESYVKYMGIGIDDTFSSFSVVANGAINSRINCDISCTNDNLNSKINVDVCNVNDKVSNKTNSDISGTNCKLNRKINTKTDYKTSGKTNEVKISFLPFDPEYCLCLCAKNINKIEIFKIPEN